MNGVLCDTDFLIAAMLSTESTHQKAQKLYGTIGNAPLHMITLVKYELANVLSRKLEHGIACNMLRDLLAQPIQVVSAEAYEDEALALYYAQTRKNISFTDCANIVVAEKFGWKIASFDAFYPKHLRVI